MASLARVIFCSDDVIACLWSHSGDENWTHQATAKQESSFGYKMTSSCRLGVLAVVAMMKPFC